MVNLSRERDKEREREGGRDTRWVGGLKAGLGGKMEWIQESGTRRGQAGPDTGCDGEGGRAGPVY